nr:MAG TPA: hypothetical protein [Caudoviricetes sp.]
MFLLYSKMSIQSIIIYSFLSIFCFYNTHFKLLYTQY